MARKFSTEVSGFNRSQAKLKLDAPKDCPLPEFWVLRQDFFSPFKIILAEKSESSYIYVKAEVVELADTLCSGRSARWACGFKSRLRHQIQTKVTNTNVVMSDTMPPPLPDPLPQREREWNSSFKNLHFHVKHFVEKKDIELY